MGEQSTEKLIEEVDKRPALYMKSHQEYSDNNEKKKLWEEVCTTVIENWNGLAPEEKRIQGNYQFLFFIRLQLLR